MEGGGWQVTAGSVEWSQCKATGCHVWERAARLVAEPLRCGVCTLLGLPPDHACRVLCMPVQVGKEGVITVQDGKTLENELEVRWARCAVLRCAVNMLCCNPAGG